MEALIPFVLFIVVWIIAYKYFANKKLMAKWKSHLLGFVISSFAFVISIIILVPNSTKEKNTPLKVENEIKKEQPIEVTPKVTQDEQSTQSTEEERIKAQQYVNELIKGKDVNNNNKYKQKFDSIASNNMDDVVKSLKENYNIVATNFDDKEIKDNKTCLHDKFCEVYAKKVQIHTTLKNVEAYTNSKVTPKHYQQVCNAIMIGLTGANKELVEQQMPQYFNYASKNGRSTWEALGIEITIAPDSSNLLGCSFYKK